MLKLPPANLIRLRGVRHNNLKGFNLDLPLGKLIVITGLSGSGKSSLAFDTLFAEGQRRYIETFSPYARQFFDRMDKPAVDSIEGIPPAIAIEQRNAVRSTRSTVGTMTEICDHLKVLWPHLATLHCRTCGKPVVKEPPQKVWEVVAADVRRLHSNAECGMQNAECLVTFDLALSEKLSIKESLELIAKQGYQRLLENGAVVRLEDAPRLITNHLALITVLQDRLKLTTANRARFIEACEQAYHFGKGRLAVHFLDREDANAKLQTPNPKLFSNRFHCAACNLDYREPSPALFSFNHPVGACPTCKGFGRTIGIDYDLAVPDRSLSLAGGAVKPWRTGTGAESQADMAKFCKKLGVPMDVPFRELSDEYQRWVIEGDPGYDSRDPANSWPKKWYGVKGYFRWLESKSYKMHVRVLLSRYRSYTRCPACEGKRLQPEALLYRVSNDETRITKPEPDGAASDSSFDIRHSSLSLADFYALPVSRALEVIEVFARQHGTRNTKHANNPIAHALEEVSSRLRYLAEVGLGYLTLDRATRTLSGGETERVNLTTCLGTRLVNTLYVLDEPSVGLHPRDTARLVTILQRLRDLGNTVVVVEHEAAVMRAADQIVDLGPGHGETGGELVFQGTLAELLKHPVSLTGQYLSGRKQVGAGEQVGKWESKRGIERARRSVSLSHSPTFPPAHFLTLSGASAHNLKNLTLSIPLGRFVCLTGVSGSGKSTLVRDCLLPALQAKLQAAQTIAKASDRLEPSESTSDADEPGASPTNHSSPITLHGAEHLSRAILVDQSALGKTPRSNPAVYIGAFDDLRDLFAATELAKQRGLNSSAFSFNSAVGQCDRCRGAGFEKIEMQFLSDIFIKCPACEGRRYRAHILEVKVRSSRREEAPSSQSAIKQSLLTSAATEIEWSIADLLAASVDESLAFLAALPDSKSAQRAAAALRVLQEVGLGYLRLGQPINTLSGGESQRLKLAAHLAESVAADVRRLTSETTVEEIRAWAQERAPNSKLQTQNPEQEQRLRTSSPTLFIFDEPTTGLHFDDVHVLVAVFQRLVDAGHTVLVIEHNLDVIRAADWLIDLGPEAGDAGGELVIAGTPEQVAACERSHTGGALRGETTQPSTKEAQR
jgi:excinuclease ABC subunit A